MMCQIAIRIGKFHGVIEATTPSGLRRNFDTSRFIIFQHLNLRAQTWRWP